MLRVAHADQQTQREHIRVLFKGLEIVVIVGLAIVLNTLNAIAGHKHVGLVFGTVDTPLHQVSTCASHETIPLVLRAELALFIDSEVILVDVAVENEDPKLVFKVHWESFMKPRETGINFLARLFCQIIDKGL